MDGLNELHCLFPAPIAEAENAAKANKQTNQPHQNPKQPGAWNEAISLPVYKNHLPD